MFNRRKVHQISTPALKESPRDESGTQIRWNQLHLLSARERQVIEMYYGINEAGHQYTLIDIGAQLGISRERARQIRAQAMQKLQTAGSQGL